MRVEWARERERERERERADGKREKQKRRRAKQKSRTIHRTVYSCVRLLYLFLLFVCALVYLCK